MSKLRSEGQPMPQGDDTEDDSQADPRATEQATDEVRIGDRVLPAGHQGGSTKLPRTLAFVIVSKDRKRHEFVNKKQLKKAVFQWETRNAPYEVFELTPKAVQAKVDIQ